MILHNKITTVELYRQLLSVLLLKEHGNFFLGVFRNLGEARQFNQAASSSSTMNGYIIFSPMPLEAAGHSAKLWGY